jgi:hypothetical protein
MGDDPTSVVASRVQSPLQSPSVADASEPHFNYNVTSDPRFMGILPSPPLSSKPSVASFNRPRTSTVRTVSGDATPLVLSDPNDEWANKLGHANLPSRLSLTTLWFAISAISDRCVRTGTLRVVTLPSTLSAPVNTTALPRTSTSSPSRNGNQSTASGQRSTRPCVTSLVL